MSILITVYCRWCGREKGVLLQSTERESGEESCICDCEHDLCSIKYLSVDEVIEAVRRVQGY